MKASDFILSIPKEERPTNFIQVKAKSIKPFNSRTLIKAKKYCAKIIYI
jgi:hypothetical protein